MMRFSGETVSEEEIVAMVAFYAKIDVDFIKYFRSKNSIRMATAR